MNSAAVLESGIMKYVVPLLQADTDDVTEKVRIFLNYLQLYVNFFSFLIFPSGVIIDNKFEFKWYEEQSKILNLLHQKSKAK